MNLWTSAANYPSCCFTEERCRFSNSRQIQESALEEKMRALRDHNLAVQIFTLHLPLVGGFRLHDICLFLKDYENDNIQIYTYIYGGTFIFMVQPSKPPVPPPVQVHLNVFLAPLHPPARAFERDWWPPTHPFSSNPSLNHFFQHLFGPSRFHPWIQTLPNCYTLPNYLMMMWLTWKCG